MIWLLILLTLGLTCTGQLLQKSAANHHRWQPLVAAIGCLGLGALCWLVVLQQLPVGIAYPMLSLNYIFVMVASHWIFNEPIIPRQWFGVIAIILGVSLIGSHL